MNKRKLFLNKIMVVFLILLFNSYLIGDIYFTGFEWDNSEWHKSGDTTYITEDYEIFQQGNKSIRLSGNKSKIEMSVKISPFNVVQYAAFIKVNDYKNSKTKLFVKYYDKQNMFINEYSEYATDTNWAKLTISSLVPPFANIVVFGCEYEASNQNNFSNIDACYWNNNEVEFKNQPICNYDNYLKPFSITDTVFNETVLMYSENNQPANGKLLFKPNKILSINKFDLSETYHLDIDYKLDDNIITRLPNSKILYRADTSFAKGDFEPYGLYENSANSIKEPQWIVASYTHQRNWSGPYFENKYKYLPKTITKLRKKSNVNIVAIGMSITKGLFVSGFADFKPYLSSYIDLLKIGLYKNYYYDSINVYNSAMPGSRITEYGIECIDKYVTPLKPDLLIIDYGMVEFWNINSDLFKKSLDSIINKTRFQNPNIEFILLSNMMYDPEFLKLDGNPYKEYCNFTLHNYQKIEKDLESLGIANVDINTISDTLQKRKKPKDLLVDPLHPNDYMERWYAQGLISALVPVMSGSINKVVNRTNQLVLDNLESKVAQSKVGTNEIIISNKQDWEFNKLENGNNRILSNDSKLALAFENGELIQAIIKDTNSQEWELIPLDDQFYKLKNIATQKYLSIDTISNKLILENESNSNAQQWNIFYSYKKEELALNRDTTFIDYIVDTSHSLQIESNTNWTVTTTANWVHFDKNEGNGKKTLKLSIDENLDKSQRAALIEISTNGLKKQHFVIQSGSKTSINDTNQSNVKFRIIPPSANDNNIYLICHECLTTNITVEIFDMTGRVVFLRDYSQSNQMIKIESNQFSSGQYIIKVNNGNQAITEKVVIMK